MKTIKLLNIIAVCAAAATMFLSCDSIDYPDRYKVADGNPTVYSVR